MKLTSLRHAVPAALLAGVTCAWLAPVLARFPDVVPGAAPGDNLNFVWNLWWMRRALSDGYPLFFSPLIFHPLGVDLTLHTHTALPALAAAVLAPDAPLLAANNAVVAVHLFLNFAAAYALALRTSRHVPGALLAALIFGASPYVGAHLPGHFNLVAAWTLPLTALCTLMTLEGERRGPWLLGLSLAATVYVDYYYAVYGALLAATNLAASVCRAGFVPPAPSRAARIASAALAGAVLLAVVTAGVIALTGGTALTLGGVRVSVRSVTNPLSVAWVLLMVLALVRWAPRARVEVDWPRLRRSTGTAIIVAGVMLAAAAPLALRAARLWQSGDYPTQRYFWRSAPRGIDVATLLLGNPSGRLTAHATTEAYTTFGIDAVEQVGWIGPGVLLLCAVAWARRRDGPGTGRWWCVAGVFGLWALGPRLAVFGRDIGLILPALFIRFVPIVANARMPGRAMVVVYLALAILAAHAVRALVRSGDARAGIVAAVLATLVIVDYWPAAPGTYEPGHPAIYDALASDASPGAVMELPLGLRDGFGEVGRLDPRTLYYQTIHGRPVFGGFVARLPPSVVRHYRTMPITGSLLRLSEGGALAAEDLTSDRAAAGAALGAAGVRFVIVNVPQATPDLLAYVREVLPLARVAEDAERVAYVVRRDAR